MWQHWLNVLLGLWLIVSAFLGLSASAMTTNLVIVGIAVAVLGLWEGVQYNMRSTRMDDRRHSHA